MKAILLGSIGVITETSELQRQSYNEAFRHHGLDWYWSIANYCELLKKPGGLKRLVTFGGLSVDMNIIEKFMKHGSPFLMPRLRKDCAREKAW